MKHRRIIAVLLVLALLLALLPASAVAATSPYAEHEHTWREISRKESTCVKEGKVTYACACGQTKTEALKKKSHIYGSWNTIKEATCTEQGEKTRKCKVCGHKEKRRIDRLPHTWGEWTVTVAPTDFSMGTRAHVCQICDTEKAEDFYPDPTYKRGDRGDAVRDLQEKLNAAGYDCGTADGQFGKKTAAAVSALEEAHGVAADGIAWPGVQKWLAPTVTTYSLTSGSHDLLEILHSLTDGKALDAVPLQIVDQPSDCILPKGGGTRVLKVQVEGGMAPYTYTLTRSGKSVGVQVDEGSFAVDRAGRYCIFIEDAGGQRLETREVTVRNYGLYLIGYTHKAKISSKANNKSGSAGCYLNVSAVGGKKPYRYIWYRNGRYDCVKASKNRYVKRPGEYRCMVRDADGLIVYTGNIRVTYADLTPVIVKQPGTIKLPASAKTGVLTCRAISATGNDSGLSYLWQKKLGNGWINFRKGQTLSLKGNGIGGVYRCVVTDNKTARKRISANGMVRMALAIGTMHQSALNASRAKLGFQCKGGCSPYRVTIQMKKYYTGYNASKQRWTGKYKLKTVVARQLQTTKGSFTFSAAVPRKYRTQVNGKTVETNAEYVITVACAATGQKTSKTYIIKGK